MYFDKIKAINFLSFESLDYDFKTGKPVLIVGENLTDDSQVSNGSGKSSIQAAVEFCTQQTTSKKTNNSQLVRWGCTEAYLSLSIVCPVRKETLLIERKIHIKNGGQSQLSINGAVKYSFEDKQSSSIDDFLIKWIGISKEDLQNYFIVNKFRYTSFFEASNTKVVQLIGRFSNASIVEGLDKEILQKTDSESSNIQSILDEINRLSGKIDVYNEGISVELNRNFEKEKQEKIDKLLLSIEQEKETINSIEVESGGTKREITTTKADIDENKSLLSETQKNIDKLKETTYEKELSEIDSKIDSVGKYRTEIDSRASVLRRSKLEAEGILDEIQKNIQGSVKCPKCSHEFLIGNPDVDIEVEREQLPEVKAMVDDIYKSLLSIKDEYAANDEILLKHKGDRKDVEVKESELNNKIKAVFVKINSIEQQIIKGNNKILRYEEVLSMSSNRVSLKLNEIENIENDIKTVKESVQDTSSVINKLKLDIKEVEGQIEQLNESEQVIEDRILGIKQWSLNFKSFYQYLSNKTLKVIESYTNKFLSKMRSDLRVQVEGYKVKSDGSLSEKITVNIIRDGEVRDFNSFSGGERARLEAAIILTIVEAINSTHPYGGLNFISVDEIFESADVAGISNLMDSFSELEKTILVTTQMPVSNVNCDVLKVIKEFKISRIDG